MNSEISRMFLRQHVKLAALVGTGSGVLTAFLLSIFPDLPQSDAALIAASWPNVVRDLFGDPLLGFSEIHAWASLQVFHIMYWIIFSGLAALISANVIARDIEHKTIDILLSCPVSRTDLVVSRMLSVFLLLAVAAVPVFAGAAVGILLAGHTPHVFLIGLATINGLFLALTCGALTLLLSAVVQHRIASIAGALAAYGVLFFCEAVLVPLFPALEVFQFLSLFHFYEADRMLIEGAPSVKGTLVLATVAGGMTLLSAGLFRARDIAQ